MSFLNKLSVRLCYKKVGTDQFGNDYYENNKADSFGNKKRCVIYKGIEEPSKVPPLWHAWLHHLMVAVPHAEDLIELGWQKSHLPNLTGTKWSYNPLRNGAFDNKPVSTSYVRWQPK